MPVHTFAVGPLAENCFVLHGEDSSRAIVIDPGEEVDRLFSAITGDLWLKVETILITHTHFDHIGAVAPLAEKTGAPVFCPELEKFVLADINRYVPYPDLGPYESYEADETVKGGEKLNLAGLEIDVFATPGHSPGHVSYSIPSEQALFSGDVLFKGSVGRTDLPAGDTDTLLRSIAMLIGKLPGETIVYPGHGEATTLAEELATNPFLQGMTAR